MGPITMQMKSICFLAKIFILLAVLALGVTGIYAAIGLYADGSSSLFSILTSNGYYDFDKPRRFAQIITQTPVVLAIKLGVKDLNFLIRMHTLGLIAIPLGFWISALLLQIKNNFFWLLALAFAVSYLSSGFFAGGEYNITYAMTAFCAAIIFRRDIGVTGAAILVVTAIALTRSYEAMVFLGPLLFSVSIIRAIKEKRDSTTIKIALVVAAFLFAAASAVSAWSIMFPRDPGNLADAANISSINANQFVYLATVTVLALIACINHHPLINKIIASVALMVSILFLASPTAWNTAVMHYQFRSMSGLMLFSILFASAFLYFYRKSNEKKPMVGNTIAAGFIVTTVLVTLFIPFYVEIFGFFDWARTFESEALEQTDVSIINKPDIYDSEFSWGWTNPSLSILLRGNADGIILNRREGWQPFDPKKLNKNPLSKFEKPGKLYR